MSHHQSIAAAELAWDRYQQDGACAVAAVVEPLLAALRDAITSCREAGTPPDLTPTIQIDLRRQIDPLASHHIRPVTGETETTPLIVVYLAEVLTHMAVADRRRYVPGLSDISEELVLLWRARTAGRRALDVAFETVNGPASPWRRWAWRHTARRSQPILIAALCGTRVDELEAGLAWARWVFTRYVFVRPGDPWMVRLLDGLRLLIR